MRPVYRADAVRRDEIARAITRVLEAEPIVSYAYLHGSFVSERAFHDVDVAVFLSDTAQAGARLAMDLSERMSAGLGVPVDVRSANDAPLSFRFHALRGRLLLSRDDDRLAQAIEDTARRYLDIEPLLRIATREAFVA